MEKPVIILFYPLVDSKEIFPNIPWALLHLERMVRHLDIEIVLIDERLNTNYSEILINYSNRIMLIGISSMVGFQIYGGLNFSNLARKLTNSPIIWGGWFPTVFPEVILKEGVADYICVGQGEHVFKEFIERLINNNSVKDIPGLGFVENGQITINKNHRLSDPYFYPRVDFNLIDLNKLIDLKNNDSTTTRSIDYMGSTGCPNNCGFCSSVYIFEKKWFAQNIDVIISDIIYFKKVANINNIVFSDDNLFASKAFVIELCNKMIEVGLNITWSVYAHIGYFLKNFSDQDIKLIYRAGCRELRIGAESGDQNVLNLIEKKTSLKNNLKIVKILKKNNIHIRFFAMVCFPENPEHDFRMTLSMLGKAMLIYPNIDAHIRFFVPLPHTPLFKLSLAKGFIPPNSSSELLEFFSEKFSNNFLAPWCKKSNQIILNDFLMFYYVFTDKKAYKKFTPKVKPYVYLLNKLLLPLIWIRINLRFFNFRFESFLFKRVMKYKIN